MKSSLALAVIAALTAPVAHAQTATRMPLQDGEYSSAPCRGTPDITQSIGIHTLSSGPQRGRQSISPQAEDQEGYCAPARYTVSGQNYKATVKCESGTRMALDTGTYRLDFTIVDPTTFVSKGKTYRRCSAHR